MLQLLCLDAKVQEPSDEAKFFEERPSQAECVPSPVMMACPLSRTVKPCSAPQSYWVSTSVHRMGFCRMRKGTAFTHYVAT